MKFTQIPCDVPISDMATTKVLLKSEKVGTENVWAGFHEGRYFFMNNHASLCLSGIPTWGAEITQECRDNFDDFLGETPMDLELRFHPDAWEVVSKYVDADGEFDIKLFVSDQLKIEFPARSAGGLPE